MPSAVTLAAALVAFCWAEATACTSLEHELPPAPGESSSLPGEEPADAASAALSPAQSICSFARAAASVAWWPASAYGIGGQRRPGRHQRRFRARGLLAGLLDSGRRRRGPRGHTDARGAGVAERPAHLRLLRERLSFYCRQWNPACVVNDTASGFPPATKRVRGDHHHDGHDQRQPRPREHPAASATGWRAGLRARARGSGRAARLRHGLRHTGHRITHGWCLYDTGGYRKVSTGPPAIRAHGAPRLPARMSRSHRRPTRQRGPPPARPWSPAGRSTARRPSARP